MAENTGEERHRAGLFDIRFIIAALIGVYGVILVFTAFFTSDSQKDKADGLNINLWAGIGMVVVAVAFFLWARLRPVIVPADPDGPAAGGSHGH
jgi:drug/metabolite transporter (DMT)-like permease